MSRDSAASLYTFEPPLGEQGNVVPTPLAERRDPPAPLHRAPLEFEKHSASPVRVPDTVEDPLSDTESLFTLAHRLSLLHPLCKQGCRLLVIGTPRDAEQLLLNQTGAQLGILTTDPSVDHGETVRGDSLTDFEDGSPFSFVLLLGRSASDYALLSEIADRVARGLAPFRSDTVVVCDDSEVAAKAMENLPYSRRYRSTIERCHILREEGGPRPIPPFTAGLSDSPIPGAPIPKGSYEGESSGWYVASGAPLPPLPHLAILEDDDRRIDRANVRLTAKQQNDKTRALHRTLEGQAVRIQRLLGDNERLGAALREVQSREAALLARFEEESRSGLRTHYEEAVAEIHQLRRWRDICVARLGPTPELANHQIDILRSYVTALESPGHRAIAWLGRRIGRGWLGRILRRTLAFVIAVRKA